MNFFIRFLICFLLERLIKPATLKYKACGESYLMVQRFNLMVLEMKILYTFWEFILDPRLGRFPI